MAAMRAHQLLLLCVAIVNGQRRPPQEDEDYGRGNRLSGRPPPPRCGQPDLSRDVGEFPYPRGETPVFNFDQGDESASTPSPLRRHCQWTETASSGGRRLWTRQSVVRTSPSSPRWPA